MIETTDANIINNSTKLNILSEPQKEYKLKKPLTDENVADFINKLIEALDIGFILTDKRYEPLKEYLEEKTLVTEGISK